MVACYLSGAHSHSFPSSVLVCVFPVLKKLLWALIERPPVVVREFKVSGGAELFSSFPPPSRTQTTADEYGKRRRRRRRRRRGWKHPSSPPLEACKTRKKRRGMLAVCRIRKVR